MKRLLQLVAGRSRGFFLLLRRLRQASAFLSLAAQLKHPVPTSIVILGAAEVHGTANVRLGEALYLYRDLHLETQGGGEILIGDGVVLSRGVHLVAFDRITIEEGAMIGEYTSVRDANHRIVPGESLRGTGHVARRVFIGRNAWIGRGVMVLPGVRIGAGAVVGANAVVSSDVPDGVIVAGVPARVIESRRAA